MVSPVFCWLTAVLLAGVRANHHEGVKSQARIMLADGKHTTRQVHTLLARLTPHE